MEKTASRSIVGLGRLWEAAELLRAHELPRPPVGLRHPMALGAVAS